ncbi:tetratricopeptide repeat protein [Pseudomonas sp. RIT-PI-S]|uniref:tetratricopeptide repeat protein n=1 Tax=Pseudomonas sp. RIT-PI-S TaxID=3035295 RepID=UPI0021D8B5EC|nr:tetratricopeptide repeat protein [Pseudomonas sp. RIT-PI-S]
MTRALRPLLIACFILLLGAAAWYFSRPLPPAAPTLPEHSYQQALSAAQAGAPGAARLLYQQLARDDLPATSRAALYPSLPDYPSARALGFATADLHNAEPAVRHGAMDALTGMTEGAARAELLGPLLDDADEAIRTHAARALLELNPDDVGVYFARLHEVLGAYSQRLEDTPGDYTAQLELARLRLHEGAARQAATAAQRVLQLRPNALQARVLLAQALDRLGQPDEAREALAEPLREHPDDAFLQHELGIWLLAHGQEEYALLALARAVELAPDAAGYRFDLATSLHSLEQPEAAQAQLDQLVRRQPANRQARLRLIEYWKEAGQLQNVQVLLAELEQQNPDDPALQQGL